MLIVLIASSGFAQQRYRFNRISIDQDLSQKKVYCILQDQKGFLWFGTEEGLLKYDGYDFTRYQNNPENPNSLSNNYILSIYEDSEGLIWIGTYGGLNKFNPQTETFNTYIHHPHDKNSISNNYIWSIIEDKEGYIWLGTYEGLNRYDKQKDKFTAFKHEPDNTQSLSNDYVWSLLEDSQGNIWIGTYNGLNVLNKKNGTFKRYFSIPSDSCTISNNDIRVIYEDRNNDLWIGTYGGLNKLNPETDKFQRFSHNPNNSNSLSDNAVRTITSDNMGSLWIGTANGLNRMTDKNFIHLKNNEKDIQSLSSNDILSLFQDKYGSLWIGTSKDINKFDPINDKFTHICKDRKGNSSISDNNIWAIYEDEQTFWVGTAHGLNEIERQTSIIKHHYADLYSNNSLSYDYILSITKDFDNNLWIGTYGGGLNKYNLETRKFEVFYNNPLDTNSISNDKIWRIYIDSDSIIWIATYEGLNKFVPEKNIFKKYLHHPKDSTSLSNNYVLSICEDPHKNLWIGTDNGLNKFNKQTELFTHYKNIPNDPNSVLNNTIWSVCNDERGFVWIGTHGGGINCLNTRTGNFSHWTTKDGLATDIIYGLLQDNKGSIWMSTNKGISKFMPQIKDNKIQSFKIRNYDISDGIQGLEFNGGAYFKSASGKMYFGGTNGLNAFFPDSVKDNNIAPDLSVTSLKIFNKEVKVKPNGRSKKNKLEKIKNEYFLPKHISYLDEITLSHRDNVIQIEFTALHYSLPEGNQYAYMLENFEKEWNFQSDKRFANYTNLDPGTYIFRVKASNCDGTWNEEGIALTINITPPFYSTWTFRVIIFLLLLLAVVIYIRYREKKIHAQKRILEEMVAKRTYEIIQQKEEIEEQRDEIQNQRDEIRKKNKNITDSIRYALKIQQAILPPDKLVKELLGEAFILYLPKDIVSGDFYWLREKDDKILIAAVDCTGHGVPGAFMSIVANNLLNQAINEQNLSVPSEILDYVNQGINETFTYNNKSNVKDGMDIALCAISKDKTLEYAGAFNPLYIVRNNELIQYKADSRSIEVSHIALDKNFTNNSLQLQANDTIYIFTDGFVDQFGGPNRKKFLKKRLRETVLSMNDLPFEEQKEKMLNLFKNWQGNNEQTDDVLIIGIKF